MSPSVQIEFQEVLNAYETLENIYPRVLPLTMWRAWELAAYKHFTLTEPVLDLACGDGSFFKLAWPQSRNVIGIDIDPTAVKLAQATGIYKEVHNVSASDLPFESGTFESIFSNCALEHMDHIEGVISEAYRVLNSQGVFLLSVVTDHLLSWTPLPFLTQILGFPERWEVLKQDYERFHHLRNPFSEHHWAQLFKYAGFEIEECIAIVPDAFAHIFLLADQLWHLPYQQTEASALIHPVLLGLPNYIEGTREILSGLYKLSMNNGQGAGMVFALRKT